MNIVQFSRHPTPLIHLHPKLFHFLDLGRPISNKPFHPSPNDNQSVKRKHNPRMTIIWYQILPLGRLSFSISTHESCLGFLTSFHLAETSLSAFLWLYTLVFAVAQNYHEMTFICNYLHFLHLFCNQLVSFAQLENVNKLWNNNCTVHVSERNQNKNKTKSRHTQIDQVFYCSN